MMSKDVMNIRLDNGKKHHEQKTKIPSNKNATRRRWSITLKSCEPPTRSTRMALAIAFS
jgi:hypothetical protein